MKTTETLIAPENIELRDSPIKSPGEECWKTLDDEVKVIKRALMAVFYFNFSGFS